MGITVLKRLKILSCNKSTLKWLDSKNMTRFVRTLQAVALELVLTTSLMRVVSTRL